MLIAQWFNMSIQHIYKGSLTHIITPLLILVYLLQIHTVADHPLKHHGMCHISGNTMIHIEGCSQLMTYEAPCDEQPMLRDSTKNPMCFHSQLPTQHEHQTATSKILPNPSNPKCHHACFFFTQDTLERYFSYPRSPSYFTLISCPDTYKSECLWYSWSP
jgi:hypothetical protein